MGTCLHDSLGSQEFKENHWSSTRNSLIQAQWGKPEAFAATKATSRRRQSECEGGEGLDKSSLTGTQLLMSIPL